jgi:hypothetical protein
MDLFKVSGGRFIIAMAGSLVLDKSLSHIEKKRDRGGIGLRLPPFYKYMQQPNRSWLLG